MNFSLRSYFEFMVLHKKVLFTYILLVFRFSITCELKKNMKFL